MSGTIIFVSGLVTVGGTLVAMYLLSSKSAGGSSETEQVLKAELDTKRELRNKLDALYAQMVDVATCRTRIAEVQTVQESLKAEPRIFLWESALSVIKEKPIFGYGISDAQEHFDIARTKFQTDEYRENWKAHNLLDSHNQYLQTTMEHGIIGLIILLYIYIYPVFLADRNRKLFSFLLLFLCAYQSTFDMFITGKFSAIFCILVILILSVENNIVLKEPEKGIEK